MTEGDTYVNEEQGVADGDDFIIDGSTTDTGAAEVHEFGGEGDAEVYRELDPDNDGSWSISRQIDSLTGEWHSQQNQLPVSESKNLRIRIHNGSGEEQDYFAAGLEVADEQEV